MRLDIHPRNPEPRLIQRVVDVLRGDGVIVCPTDSVYALACDAQSKRGVDKIHRVSRVDKHKLMSLLCQDFSQVATFAKVSQVGFRALRHHMPGPYVFILEASRAVPKLLLSKRKTIGIRIPDAPIPLAIIEALGSPLLTTSVKDDEGDFFIDPVDIDGFIGTQVDLVIDGGPSETQLTSVVSLIDDQPEILRQGKGDLSWFG